MQTETEYNLDGHNYLITQLPLAKQQEVLLRVTKLLGGDGEISLASLPSRVSVADINFLREHLLGQYCQVQNENGNWVPLGKALVENHFAGHLGTLFHILGKCLVHNFADFLADLRLDELAGSGATSFLQESTGLSGDSQ